jgi:methyl-accepting chemotaxis protein
MKSWKIRAKLALVLSVVGVVFAGAVYGVFGALKAQDSDAAIVNLAGRQRMLSQKMTKEALGVAKDAEDQDAYRKALGGTAGLFDRTLSALLDGGGTTGGGGDPVTLPATSDAGIREQLAVVQGIWDPFNTAVKTIISGQSGHPDFNSALAHIEANSIPLLKNMNKAVGMYEQVSRGKLATVKMLMFALLGLAGLAGGAIFLFMQRVMLKPLGELTVVAAGVATGDATLEVKHHSGDELGALADSFRGVLDYFHGMVNGLEALSQGRLDCEVESRGEQDVLAHSYEQLRGTVSELIGNLGELSEGAVHGRVNDRGDATQFQGGFSRIVSGINSLLDALVGHLDAVPSPVVILDRDSRVLHANPATGQLVNAETEQLYGQPWSEFVVLRGEPSECPLKKAMADASRYSIDCSISAGGEDHEIDYTAVPVTDDSGRVVGALAVITDLTEVRQAGKLAEKRARYQSAEVERLASSLHQLAVGELDLEYSVAPGDADTAEIQKDFQSIQGAVTGCIVTLRQLIDDVGGLAQAGAQGKLDSRADVSLYRGDYARIITGLNETLDAFTEPLNAALHTLERVADRDLSVSMDGSYKGQFADLQHALNSAVGKLQAGMSQVADASGSLTFAAKQIGVGSQELANSNSVQASSLEEIAANMKEITSQSRDTAALATEVQTVSEGAQGTAGTGLENMGDLTNAMEKIQKSASEISSIVSTIDEIAFQTNLLALNAAVEAASAGDAGKGFAVVAEEVRNLAIRSAEAAKATGGMIEDAVKNADNGIRLNEAVRTDLSKIHEQVEQMGGEVLKIVELSRNQEEGTRQVDLALEQINQATQQNAANSEESASSSQEMASQAGMLRDLVDSFELGSSDQQAAIGSAKPRVTENELIGMLES